ncbi:DUF1707 domain-containing protein [Spongiactinospora sp. TRM90649]|uniref:DUF1707 SHOCT-like domain-containing protein n=1 Tax=Spongiactinospora sp. TRM90649 TaxID=3031114 RepID=UPI0023FA4152|nr:DUF1707 domain-containing protein [Spongiactinospora sp. TRM90649]MDF5757885.1 DUF1707 domain-containing protein [Spongiactinospora sp. TRM90649]
MSDAMRASDAEREAVVERLKTASVDGRLTFGELAERTEVAYGAATRAELDAVLSDLPESAPAPAASAAEGVKRRWFVSVMGETKRRGKWRIDRELGAVAVMGDVLLDLREAEVRGNQVDLMAVSVMGDVKIIVPDGVDVELEGVAIMGDKRVDVMEAPAGTDVPVIRVKAYALMGDIKIIGDSRADPIQRGWAVWRDHLRAIRDRHVPPPPRSRW